MTWEYLNISVADNSTTIVSGGPVILGGIVVTTTLSAHALPIEDADGGVVAAMAASATAGTVSDFGEGIEVKNGLVLDPHDSGTGDVTVYYRRGGM